MEPSFVIRLALLVFCFHYHDAGAMFLSGPAAHKVLQRHKRANTGMFEELQKGNLERECNEEVCVLEEAREVFENDKATAEFWAQYTDPNKCRSKPCLNGGLCVEKLKSFDCLCLNGFTGRKCELLAPWTYRPDQSYTVAPKRCDVNNGDCMHFCKTTESYEVNCTCAGGYRLKEDNSTCEPEGDFPCGRTALADVSATDTGGPGEDSAQPLKRTRGGDYVAPGEIPWQVALIQRPGYHFMCAGTILSERWVVTSATCAFEDTVVRVGDYQAHTIDEAEHDHEVMRKYVHPHFDKITYDHDIALFYLSTSINFSATVRPICLGPPTFTNKLVKDASPATTTLFGRMWYKGPVAERLQKVEVKYTDSDQCDRISKFNRTSNMFCAVMFDEGREACQGDGGGGHMNKFRDTWFLTGIASWAAQCGGHWQVYTRVSAFNHWINSVMEMHNRTEGVIKMEGELEN